MAADFDEPLDETMANCGNEGRGLTTKHTKHTKGKGTRT